MHNASVRSAHTHTHTRYAGGDLPICIKSGRIELICDSIIIIIKYSALFSFAIWLPLLRSLRAPDALSDMFTKNLYFLSGIKNFIIHQ